MWKLSGKHIFSRWQQACQAAVKTHVNNQKEICLISSVPDQKRNSNQDDKYEQHAHKQHQRFSDNPHFQNHTFCNQLLETVGWVGATAICLDVQHNLLQKPRRDGKKQCIFSGKAFAMPKLAKKIQGKSETFAFTDVKSTEFTADTSREEPIEKCLEKKSAVSVPELSGPEKDLAELNQLACSSIAILENSIGGIFLKKDERQAYNFFKASAQLGCPKGLFNLALCYETGHGTQANMQKAVKYYEEAATRGHMLATYNLAVCVLKDAGDSSKETEKGLQLMKLAAENGVHQAQVYLGAFHLEHGNYTDAFELFREAAEKNIEAKYYLGVCYENGWGIAANDTVATEMYAQAAKLGHEESTLKLGFFHEKGETPDEDFSMTLYKMLADKGHEGGKQAMLALKQKQATRWRIKSQKENKSNITKKLSSLHTSASVPELKNCVSQLKNSRSSSALVLQSPLNFHILIESSNHMKFHVNTKEVPNSLSLNLAVQNMFKFSPIITHIVSTTS